MHSTIRTATAMSFVPLNQAGNLAPKERLIPSAVEAAKTASILGKGQRAEQPSEKLAALAKKRGI
jgi:hypothetical protein